MIHLENVLKISMQDILKMSWRRLKTSWRRLEDVLKTFWRRLEDVWPRRIYWSWSRRLEEVLKTSSEDEDERRLQDVFIKTNVWWVSCLMMKNIYLLIASFFFFKRNFFLIQKNLFLVQVFFTHFCYCKSIICFLLKWMWRTSITSSSLISTAVNRLSFVFKFR